VKRLGSRAALRLLADADHSFRVPSRSTLTSRQVNDEMLTALTTWAEAVTA
jgi:hypothetical protein